MDLSLLGGHEVGQLQGALVLKRLVVADAGRVQRDGGLDLPELQAALPFVESEQVLQQGGAGAREPEHEDGPLHLGRSELRVPVEVVLDAQAVRHRLHHRLLGEQGAQRRQWMAGQHLGNSRWALAEGSPKSESPVRLMAARFTCSVVISRGSTPSRCSSPTPALSAEVRAVLQVTYGEGHGEVGHTRLTKGTAPR